MRLTPEERFRLIEERRKATEAVLWQLPGVSLAAQAFLLSAGLNPDAEPESQVAVGALGILAVIATGLVVLYQALRATTLGHWVEHTLPDSVAVEALAGDDIGLSPLQKRLLKVRNVFYVAWAVAGGAFLAADTYVLARGLGSL
jgi:hypothetical protein